MSKIISLIVAAFAVSTSARNFHIHNNCGWGANVNSPCGGYLNAGQAADCGVADNWQGRVSLNGNSASLAEFTLGGWGGMDFYDVSFIDGFNAGVQIHPDNGCPVVNCPDSGCGDAYHTPNDNWATHGCNGSPNYSITFCP